MRKTSRVIKEHPKPLTRKEWEFWEDRLGFFIQEFEDNIAGIARENIKVGEDDEHDHFLAGMAQGMWAVYKFVEDRMVKSEEGEKSDFKIVEDKPKRKYKKRGKYKKYKKDWRGTIKGRTISESHKQKIKEGISKYWRRRKKNREKFGIVVHRTIGEKTKGRAAKTMSSKDVLDVLKSFNKGKGLNTKEIFNELVKAEKISPNYGEAKNKKALADRVYILTRNKKLKMEKKGKKNYYSLP